MQRDFRQGKFALPMRTMQLLLKINAAVLLLFNGVGALYGGWSLMTDPSGQQIQLPLDFIEDTIFQNYFIPGLILFLVNGVFSVAALLSLIIRKPYAAKLVITQGILLGGWLLVQILYLHVFYWLQGVMFTVAILLVAIGLALSKTRRIQ